MNEISLRTIACAKPKREHLVLFKQYAGVADNSRDAALLLMLETAMRKVQEYADVSLLPSTLEVRVDDHEPGDPVRLYQSPREIISVTTVNGAPLGYTLEGRSLFLDSAARSVIVRYEAGPDGDEGAVLLSVVLRYATALYDGESDATLAQILSQC